MSATLGTMNTAHSQDNVSHVVNSAGTPGTLSSFPGVPMPMNSTGGAHGGLSYEMLQSFMQRNTSDGMNHGQDPGQNA